MWKCFAVFVLSVVLGVRSATIPSYIKACHKNQDFKICAVESGQNALSTLLKGDKAFGIPNLLPLKLEKIDMEAGPNLKISLKNVVLNGLESVKLKDIGIDFEKNTGYIEISANRIELVAEYTIDGKILVLPIQGNGPLKITADDCTFKYFFSFKLENKGGAEYAILQDDDKVEYSIKKAHFQLDNLFNGNKAMGDNVNKFLNENDQDVLKELGGALQGTVKVVAHLIGGAVFGNIEYSELFLE